MDGIILDIISWRKEIGWGDYVSWGWDIGWRG